MATADTVTLLRDLGAEDVPHPGGSLFDHLVRVHDLLTEWGAGPTLRHAGLCHAFYGTDGFAVALYALDRRAELAAAIGADAEELVYFYASCDRSASYPGLADEDGAFVDRFTGARYRPEPHLRRAFAELTVANELDIVRVNPAFAHTDGAANLDAVDRRSLHGLFAGWRTLLSPAANAEVERVLDPVC